MGLLESVLHVAPVMPVVVIEDAKHAVSLARALVARPFSPAFPSIIVQIGLPAAATNAHAETFARLLREESARAKRS